jgi:hypothetical protein
MSRKLGIGFGAVGCYGIVGLFASIGVMDAFLAVSLIASSAAVGLITVEWART